MGGHFIDCLVDTGCSTTCVAESEIQRSPILQSFLFCPQQDIGHSINGNDVITLGLLKLQFEIGDRSFVVNARIMRGLVRPLVLGWDFLYSNKAIINTQNSTLTVKNVTVPFLKRNRWSTAPHLSAYENTVLPPLCRMPVKSVVHADLEYIESNGASSLFCRPLPDTCPTEGVLVGSSISSLSSGLTYCELLNTLPTPVLICEGTPLAEFEFMNEEAITKNKFYMGTIS